MPRARTLPVNSLTRALDAVLARSLPVSEIRVTADGARIIIGDMDGRGRGDEVPTPVKWTEDD